MRKYSRLLVIITLVVVIGTFVFMSVYNEPINYTGDNQIISIELSVTNIFLIPVNDKYVLIDTGYEKDWLLFQKGLSDNNISLNQISHIILTHHHDDHAGLLNNIISENNEIIIIMSELAPELLSVGMNDVTRGGGLLNRRVNFLIRNFKTFYISVILGEKLDKNDAFKFPPYYVRDNDIIIKEETDLRYIGIDLDGKIICTPGHTIDSISIILGEDIIFVGDAAANMLRIAGTKYCVIFITDLNEYYRSWEKIISENVKYIFPAHGKPFRVEKLIRNIWKNKEKNMIPFP